MFANIYLYMLSATFHDQGEGGVVNEAIFCTREVLYIIHRNCYTSQGVILIPVFHYGGRQHSEGGKPPSNPRGEIKILASGPLTDPYLVFLRLLSISIGKIVHVRNSYAVFSYGLCFSSEPIYNVHVFGIYQGLN